MNKDILNIVFNRIKEQGHMGCNGSGHCAFVVPYGGGRCAIGVLLQEIDDEELRLANAFGSVISVLRSCSINKIIEKELARELDTVALGGRDISLLQAIQEAHDNTVDEQHNMNFSIQLEAFKDYLNVLSKRYGLNPIP